MTNPRLWLVAYDITLPKRLYRVAKTLESYGARQQKSVFECGLSRDEFRALSFRLHHLAQPDEGDKVFLHPLCADCRRGLRWQGKMPPAEAEPFWIV